MKSDDRPSRPSPSLFRALTLAERAADRRTRAASGDARATEDQATATARRERARRRLDAWRKQRPFDEDGRFAERLSSLGLDEAALLSLLEEPESALAERSCVDARWTEDVVLALSAPPGEPVPVPEPVLEYAFSASLQAFAPFIRRGRERLREALAEVVAGRESVPFDPGTALELAYPVLPQGLVTMVSRVVALEINVARLQGLLPQGTPEQRFAAFFERLATSEGLAGLFDEYPVLARALARQVDLWVEASVEFLERLCDDFDALREAFFEGRDPGALVGLDGGMGDTHRSGRSVQMVTFASGAGVVYKPRPLAADAHFQALILWLDDHGQEPPLRALRLVDRGEYGWVERVAAAPCGSMEELTRFYERQGANLALLYALDAADFHHENVIAVGEHPVLVDLEVLFHPRFQITGPVGSVAAAGGILDDSVLRIGLLPSRTIGGNGGRGVDLSGLGGGAGQFTPFAVPNWEARGTDHVHLGMKSIEVPPAENRPSLRGAEVDALDFEPAIVRGFERAYRLLRAHRGELLGPSGPIGRFAGDEVRVILRPTMAYSNLLAQSHHPDMLRDALDRDRFLDRLWLVAGKLARPAEVIAAEQEDLRAGDIPLFTTRPGSRDLFTSRGERIADFFDEPSLAHVERRLAGLSGEDLDKQVRFLRCSLATLRIGRDPTARSNRPLAPPRSPVASEQWSAALLAAARAAADGLAASAIRSGDQVTWIGMTLVDESYWMLAPLDADLYSGLSGVALFLGALGTATGEARYKDLATGALATLCAQIEEGQGRMTNIGAFGGWSGIVYALTRLGVLWGDDALVDRAVACAQRIPPLVASDIGLDLVNGSAGAILPLLGLHELRPSAGLLDAAIRCGDRLLDTAVAVERGIAWTTPTPQSQPLCGLSHGTTGMALALSALGAKTRMTRFAEGARAALEYEAGLFSAERSNWPDFRYDLSPASGQATGEPEIGYMTTWCHGAAGMAHARMAMLGSLGESAVDRAIRARLLSEIRAGLSTTIREGFGRSHCLCHGDAGNLELLAEAGRTLGDESLTALAREGAATLMEEVAQTGYRCGVPSGVEAPGLMAGIAGIGYGFLQLARPDLVPAVATLGPAQSAA